MNDSVRTEFRIHLLKTVICPHCWHNFSPENSHWIANHASLVGDARLGADARQRFLPTRFTPQGDAVDARGFSCTELACPHCHLEIPRAMLQAPALFASILGTPACGKSYFLGAMTWRLRQILPQQFSLGFEDVDPAFNAPVHEYEESIFLSGDPQKPAAIRKTELQGELYDTVIFDQQTVSYPRPFVYRIAPLRNHPRSSDAKHLSRLLCLYDNAGEHFLPGQDTASSPVTRHLAMSQVLLFLFDPTQDPRFRKACQGHSQDPQLSERARNSRQETTLYESAARIRKHVGLNQHQKHRRPLVVVLTKADIWQHMLSAPLPRSPWKTNSGGVASLRTELIETISAECLVLLRRLCPELVAAAESLSDQVVFVPASATGCSPQVDPETGILGVRPVDVDPFWVEIPLLYILCKSGNGLVFSGQDCAKMPPVGR